MVQLGSKRLVFEVWNDEQAVAAAKAAREFNGETIIRWVWPPSKSNWLPGQGKTYVGQTNDSFSWAKTGWDPP